jgi:hypothetical protein
MIYILEYLIIIHEFICGEMYLINISGLHLTSAQNRTYARIR